jgi:CDP-glycerol glycerophosphotransferase (TagB/SpsB family)
VTLTTTPQELYPHHDHVLRVMGAALGDGQWPAAQILVRLHPRDDRAKYAAFESVPGIIIEKPFRDTVRAGDGLAVDVTAESQRHLANTLRHSDVIVNVASTIAIEAAIFDTPVVNIAFDGEQEEAFARSARRYYQFTHYVNITRHEAVKVAWQPGELVRHVRSYLDDRAQDAAGRARVVGEQCQFTDGRSAERVAGFVIDEWRQANSSCAASPASSR